MSDRRTEIIQALEQSRQKLKGIISRLKPDDWEKTIQDEDQKWTVRQIVAHLVSGQKGMFNQIVGISEGKEGVPPDFDLNRWNRRSVEKSAERTPQDLLTALDADQAELKRFISILPEENFDKQGRHGSLRIMSIEEIGLLIASHEADHTQIIADKLGLK